MFAVIRTGGKQYRVAPGDRFTVEKLSAEPGERVHFEEVLLIGGETLTVGAPRVEGAAVQAQVVEQMRGPKLLNFKRRRRKASSKRLKGHRQHLTLVEITDILAEGREAEGRPAIGAGAARRAGFDPGPASGPGQTRAKTAEPSGSAQAAEAGGTAEAAASARPANLLDAAEGEADDLTRLAGVGPKLMEKLNANGVFHFRQIAAWTPAEVAHMDEQLGFRGRIARDDWTGQAKAFAAEET